MDKTIHITFADTSKLLRTLDIYNTGKSKLPENCFHLGFGLFLIVSVNDNKTNIHICEFVPNATGELIPTDNEIILSPFLWQSLCESFDNTEFIDLPTSFETFSLVKNELFLAVIETCDTMRVTMQKCFIKEDLSRYFIPGLVVMSEYQWCLLKDTSHLITETVIHFLLKHELKGWVLMETDRMTECPNADGEKTEAEMALSVSLCEFLKIHLEKGMNIVFKCDGCKLNYGNQLGHECMTMTDEEKLDKYFNVALTTFNLKQIASEFVRENTGLLKFITEEFFHSLDARYITDFVRKLY